jgi:hypothetical protein
MRDRRIVWAVVVAVVAIVVVAGRQVIDEQMRVRTERALNDALEGYTVRLGDVDFHLAGFSLDLEDVVVRQEKVPDPPVASIPLLSTSVHWRALFHGRLVADMAIERPAVHLDLRHAEAEARDAKPMSEKGWQEAVQAIYPLKINLFTIDDGAVTYRDEGPFEPLKIRDLDVRVENIRNVRSEPGELPSPFRITATVFDAAPLRIAGDADLLAVPQMAVKADVDLREMPLGYLEPVTRHWALDVRDGRLSLHGNVASSARQTTVDLEQVKLTGLVADYVEEPNGAATATKVAKAADDSQEEPGQLYRVRELRLENGELGYVSRTTDPHYRVYLGGANLKVEGLSNHREKRPAKVRLTGKLQGEGPTTADVSFLPDDRGADLDLTVALERVPLPELNDALRAVAGVDVDEGALSIYGELKSRKGEIDGYLKPIFDDVEVYDRAQDAGKGVGRQLYEGVVGGLTEAFQNQRKDDVATVIPLRGRIENPDAGILATLAGIFRNAFFDAIVPGLEGRRPAG